MYTCVQLVSFPDHVDGGLGTRLVYSMSCRVSSDSCVSPFLSDMLLTVNNPKLEEERTGKFMLVLLTFLSGCSHDLFVHLLMSLGLSS